MAADVYYQHEDDYDRNDSGICNSVGELHEHWASKIFFLLLYSTIMLIALIGNGLVIYVVATNKAMQTVTNLFITNLAASDIMVNLTSLWVTPVYTYLSRWVWGKQLCHTVPLFQGMSIFISSLTLTAIAIDRFTVIVHPFRKRTSIRICCTTIAFIWLLSLMLVAPYAVHMKLDYKAQCNIYICKEAWSYEQIQIVYGYVVLALQFGVPFVVITFCYVRVWRHMMQSQKRTGRRSDADVRRKRRMFKMLVGMVLIFALCWLPPNIINIIKDSGTSSSDYFVFVFLIGHAISMSSSMWNPLLYAFLNENFRREFAAVLPCCRASSQGRIRRAYSLSKLQHTNNANANRNSIEAAFKRTSIGKFYDINRNAKGQESIGSMDDRFGKKLLNAEDISTSNLNGDGEFLASCTADASTKVSSI